MSVPQELRYTKDHEWVRFENGVATIGITDFAQNELGELVFVDLPAVGKKLDARAVVCVVESTKAASDVYSPISGTVTEVNSALSSNPATVNSDPYKGGWLVKLNGVNEAELKALLSAAQYSELINNH